MVRYNSDWTINQGSSRVGFTESPDQEVNSPGRDSDAVSDLSRESNLSGLWNRGRVSMNVLTTSLNTIAERHADKLPPEIKDLLRMFLVE
jgi:hypothetical protein